VSTLILLSTPSVALAAPDAVTARTVWSAWNVTPDILVPTILVLAIYAAGLLRRPGAFEAKPWRHAAFFWGVSAAFLSLVSPLDAFADHLFFMHQIQHMLLREVGPMLIALSQPQGVLIAGLPAWLRRNGLAPVLAARVTRSVFGFLTRPLVVTPLFVASLYVWQWPPLHNLAIVNEAVHYAMHLTMLAAGLLFFWRVFDHRPAPKGTGFGARLMMLWLAVLSNIPIGAYTTFKGRELYPAYDVVGRLFPISPINDERLGGFIMWVPSSMMMLLAVVVVAHAWAANEEKADERRIAVAGTSAEVPPVTAAAFMAQQRPKNRALALGLSAFVALILAATLTIGFLALHSGKGAAAERPWGAVALASHEAAPVGPMRPQS